MNALHRGQSGNVALRNVAVRFDTGSAEVEAVRDLSVEIGAGEFVSILGPSGCGKSTLIGAVAGFTPLAGGEVVLDGTAGTRPGPDRGVVFQHHTLFPWKTVYHNVEFGLKMRGVPRGERHEAIEQILGEVGLAEFARHYPAQLSGGMQQRVNLSRALVNRPRVLLMDEPFAALDAQTRLQMQELLLELWTEIRMTVIFVTHDIDEAIFLADRLIVLSERPARVQADLAVELPRPRTAEALTAPPFMRLKRECLELLRISRAPRPRRSVASRVFDPVSLPENVVTTAPAEALGEH